MYVFTPSGGMQDFNYVFGSCSEVTFELSCCKYPMASELPQEWANNKESLLAFMEQVHMGVKGMWYIVITCFLWYCELLHFSWQHFGTDR